MLWLLLADSGKLPPKLCQSTQRDTLTGNMFLAGKHSNATHPPAIKVEKLQARQKADVALYQIVTKRPKRIMTRDIGYDSRSFKAKAVDGRCELGPVRAHIKPERRLVPDTANIAECCNDYRNINYPGDVSQADFGLLGPLDKFISSGDVHVQRYPQFLAATCSRQINDDNLVAAQIGG